jgi:prophage tail gpP-like protein
LVRQVAYDAKNHGVMLQGVSLTWYAARASIVDKDSAFEGSFLEIAGKVLAPTCSGYKTWGQIDSTPFIPAARAGDGETIFQFLERLGRDRNVMVTSDPYGDFVFIGEHVGEVVGDLVEGLNILKCQCTISDTEPYSKYIAKGQKPANDQSMMREAAEQEATMNGTAKCYSPLVVAVEHPVWTNRELELRAEHEYDFRERKIEADITLQGWFNPRTGLRWDVGQDVMVRSPMAMLNMIMKIEAVTYTQDSRTGSLTVLKCVAPWNWNDSKQLFPTRQRPRARTNTGPAETPPAQQPHSERR